MKEERSKLKEYADYIMRCNTLEEVMKVIAIGIEGMTEEEASKNLVKEKDDKKFQEEWKDYLEKR